MLCVTKTRCCIDVSDRADYVSARFVSVTVSDEGFEFHTKPPYMSNKIKVRHVDEKIWFNTPKILHHAIGCASKPLNGKYVFDVTDKVLVSETCKDTPYTTKSGALIIPVSCLGTDPKRVISVAISYEGNAIVARPVYGRAWQYTEHFSRHKSVSGDVYRSDTGLMPPLLKCTSSHIESPMNMFMFRNINHHG